MSVFDETFQVLRPGRLVFKNIMGMRPVGEIGDRFWPDPPKLADNRFGKTTQILPIDPHSGADR